MMGFHAPFKAEAYGCRPGLALGFSIAAAVLFSLTAARTILRLLHGPPMGPRFLLVALNGGKRGPKERARRVVTNPALTTALPEQLEFPAQS
jgi:hypothetical protein